MEKNEILTIKVQNKMYESRIKQILIKAQEKSRPATILPLVMKF